MSNTVRCAACSRIFNGAMGKCPFCGAVAPGARSTTAAAEPGWAALAQEAIDNHKVFMQLEFHPAALTTLDAFCDLTWGADGLGPTDDAWQPSRAQQNAIVGFGAFFGELLRRKLGGVWKPLPSDTKNLLGAGLTFPRGLEILPVGLAFRRLKLGARESFEAHWLAVRKHVGDQPHAAELEGWLRQAQFFEKQSRWDTAGWLYERALALPLSARSRAAVESAQRAAIEASRKPEAAAAAAPAPQPSAPSAPATAAVQAAAAVPPAPEAALTPAQQSAQRGSALLAQAPVDALVAFERALGLEPGNVEALLGMAQALVALARWAEARAWLRVFSGRAACEPQCTLWSARAAEGAGDLVAAHDGFRRIDGSFKLSAEEKAFVRARLAALGEAPAVLLAAAARAEPLAAAVEAYARLTQRFPAMSEPWCEQGVGLAMLGRPEEALACFERAAALEPSEPKGFDHKAALLSQLERYAEALATVDLGLRSCPRSAALLTRRGVMLTFLERRDEARQAFEAALAADPSDVDAWAFLGDLEQKAGRTPQAIAALQRYLAGKHGSQEKRAKVVRRELWRLQHPGQALDEERAVRCQEQALAHIERRALPAALPLFAQAVEANPFAVEAWMNLGLCALQLGQLPTAAEAFRQADALAGSPQTGLQLAACLQQLGRGEEALAVFERLSAPPRFNVDALRGKANALLQLGRASDALPLLRQLLARTPDDAELLRAYAAAGAS